MQRRPSFAWTFALTSAALFMVTLDNLVVSTALPVIRRELGASLEQLEWTVNAYTLTFAVLLLVGAALGDRFGRRMLFVVGMGIFTLGSIGAALATSTDALIIARAVQGLGGAIVTPLTLTLLSAAAPPDKRGMALGAWGAIGGLAVAVGPLVGGAIVDGLNWHWIFWVNVPVGVVLIPLGLRNLTESKGPYDRLDLPGLALAASGLFAIVWGLVRGNGQGWGSTEIVASLAVGTALVIAFIAWELRARFPMLPMAFFRDRAFSAANAASLLMFFGMFGSLFLLSQFFQTVQGFTPLQAGLRILPWTIMPMFISPLAGALSDKLGGGRLMAGGLALQAIGLGWMAYVGAPDTPYREFVAPFVVSGIGMALFFAPVANVILSAVGFEEEGQASGANNALRELGGVFGVAVLASVFAHQGGYRSGKTFSDGLDAALWVGAAAVGAGALIALLIPTSAGRAGDRETRLAAAAAQSPAGEERAPLTSG